MNRPTFVEAVVIAIICSVSATAFFHLLSLWLDLGSTMRLTIALTGGLYTVWLTWRAQVKPGRLFLLVLWTVATAATIALDPPLLAHVAVQLMLIWTVRVVTQPRGVIVAVIDGALGALSIGISVWVAQQTGSVLAVTWSVLLTQAVSVLFMPQQPARAGTSIDQAKRFSRAQGVAQAALRRMSNTAL